MTAPSQAARTPASCTGGDPETPKHTALLIDAKAAAAMLAMGPRTLWRHTKTRAIPARWIGRSVRYSPVELRAWIEAGCPTAPGAGERVRKGVRQ